MEVVILDSVEQGARLAADVIADHVALAPSAVLGLATGSSPEPIYAELARRRAGGEVDFSSVSAFLLDEYLGLPADHPATYRRVIERQVIAPLGLNASRVHGLDGATSDPLGTCRAYEAQIDAAGGIDVQLLGIGADGHIGFNEPGSSLGSLTRVKTLMEQTRQDNARFFDGDVSVVPRHVLTQGVATIGRARHLLLAAWGSEKADAVARAIEGPLTASVPASALQLHPHVTVIIDAGAATALERRAYYQAVSASKPTWQGW